MTSNDGSTIRSRVTRDPPVHGMAELTGVMKPDMRTRILTWGGIAVMAGGALTLLVNVGLTPFLQPDAPYAETAASCVFLWRQGLSALAAVLILAGSVALYLHNADRAGRFGAIAFLFAFVGGALLLAHEWSQIFFVHEMALRAPDALTALEAAKGPSLFDIGAIIAFLAFVLGWIMFSVSMLLAGVYPRRGPILVIAGFCAAPILSAVLPDMWGAVIGNVVLGAGWIMLGHELFAPKGAG